MPSRTERPDSGILELLRPVHDANRRLARAVSRSLGGEWAITRAVWREVRIVGTAAAGMTLVVWTVRVASQLLDVSWLNESILLGHHNDYIVSIENRIDLADRMKGGS